MDSVRASSHNSPSKFQDLPQFLVKLRHILDNPSYNKVITWGEEEGEVCILNQRQLEINVLPQFFRHHKTNSFVRQLNNYGFSKLPATKIGEDLRFRNPFFLRDNAAAMKFIKRKSKKNLQEVQKLASQETSSSVTLDDLNIVVELAVELAELVKRHPEVRSELDRAFSIMGQLVSSNKSAQEMLQEEQIKADSYQINAIKESPFTIKRMQSMCSFDDGLGNLDLF